MLSPDPPGGLASVNRHDLTPLEYAALKERVARQAEIERKRAVAAALAAFGRMARQLLASARRCLARV